MKFTKPLETISARRGSLATIFSDFVRLTACSLAPRQRVDGSTLSLREPEYMDIIQRYDRREVGLFKDAFHAFIEEADREVHVDILGRVYLEWASKSCKQARGEFYTPAAICEVMARMTVDADRFIAEGKPVRIYEPACGGGQIILSIGKLFAPDHWHLPRITAVDLNPTACDMTFINTTLWSIPCEVICDNAIFRKGGQRHFNLHWMRVGEEQCRLFRRLLDPPEIQAPPAPATAPASNASSPFIQPDLFAA